MDMACLYAIRVTGSRGAAYTCLSGRDPRSTRSGRDACVPGRERAYRVGMRNVAPARIRRFGSRLTRTNSATVVPYRRAIPLSVSPDRMR